VLLDSHLPDLHGLEILAELRRNPELAGIGVFVLSGTFHPDDSRRALELGADDYMAKPFEADDFERLVQRIEEFARSARGS
jgi:DNA-binding response OmpR family regulator